MEIFLARHGETQENVDGIIQGWLDTELNATGLQQAKALVDSFDEPIEVIYSSDLKRAVQTARGFRQKYPQVPYSEDERLRERGFGDVTGEHRDNHDWEVFWASSDTVSIPNAETLDDYNARVRSFIFDLLQLNYQKALIVTHGGTINRVQQLFGKTHEYTPHANANVTRIELE